MDHYFEQFTMSDFFREDMLTKEQTEKKNTNNKENTTVK